MSISNDMMKLAREVEAIASMDDELTEDLLVMAESGGCIVFYEQQALVENIQSISMNGPFIQLNVGRPSRGKHANPRDMLREISKLVSKGKVVVWNKQTRQVDDVVDVSVNGQSLQFNVDD